jgi:hypothetical protein
MGLFGLLDAQVLGGALGEGGKPATHHRRVLAPQRLREVPPQVLEDILPAVAVVGRGRQLDSQSPGRR